MLIILVFAGPSAQAAGDICFVCQKEIRFAIYTGTDKVTHDKVFLCGDCADWRDNCYLCGLPVLKQFTTLPDGRLICKRDFGSVIVDESQAIKICEQVKYELDRLLSRFITIPETNVTIQLMDRVRLQELFMIIGNDFSCPNTLGCTETKTNAGQRVFEISILSGQPKEDLMTTCVHEYAHTWIIQNVAEARRKTLGKDAVEGFCELLSYLFAEQQGLAAGKSNILANHYTRGQIHLFIAANRQYGLADIVDWMKSGDDRLLQADDLSRVRRMATPVVLKSDAASTPRPRTNATLPASRAAKPKLPEQLVLQGVIWSKTRPMATINGKNFTVNEESSVALSSGTVTVRCLEITPAAVLLETNNASAPLKLQLN